MRADPLEAVLALRPTNATMRLGRRCALPLLDPRELLAVLPRGAALACFRVETPEDIPAVLRACRDQDAVAGLSLPWPPAGRKEAQRLVELVAKEAEAVRHLRPLFLQGGPLRLGSTAPIELERSCAAVFELVEAGFTLLSVDASALEVEDAAACARVVEPASSRELSWEVVLPPGKEEGFLQALAEAGALPRFVRLAASSYALTARAREAYELDLGVLGAARQLAQAKGAALSVEQDGPCTPRLLRALREAQVRKLDPVERAGSGSEAGVWAWASDLLEAVGARGTASAAVARLAQGRY